MGNKRHFKGNNASEAKKARKEKEEKWRSERGDAKQQGERNDIITTNAKFEAFYKAQHINSPDEWDSFLTVLRTPLPACFRINSDYAFADRLREQLHEFAGEKTIIEDKEVEGVVQMKWYPGGYAYKLGYDRRTIRKTDTLTGLHKWMIQHTDAGNITRQEAVSMVPPLALDVHPHHRCLDMCAAPGSKTSQLLEAIHSSLSAGVLSGETAQMGVVVANDADTDRAYMLVHQCRRINSPLLVVTTHRDSYSLHSTPLATPPAATPSAANTSQRDCEFFDRVLCDVPCSGDGTMRKNPAIWSKWSTDSGAVLHPLQLSIAVRGFQLLKPGGLMVYSTCSMVPYENEAVVAELLRRFRGSIELVDGRQFIPGFKARSGLSSWYVLNDYSVKRKLKKDRRQMRMSSRAEGDVADTEENHVEEDAEDDDAEDAEGESSGCAASTVSDPSLAACIQMGMQFYRTFDDVPAHVKKKFKSSMFSPNDRRC